MPIDIIIQGFVLPAAAVFGLLVLLWRPWSAKRWGGDSGDASPRVPGKAMLGLTPIVALACFAFSHRAIIGRWPVAPPTLSTSVNDWFVYFAVVAAVFSFADSLLAQKKIVRALVRAVGCAAVSAMPVLLLIESGYYTPAFSLSGKSGPAWIVLAAAFAFVGWFAFTPRTSKEDGESRLPLVVPLGVYLGVAAPTMVLWSVAINAQVLGALALCLVPAGVITLWRPAARVYDAVLGYAVLTTFAVAASAFHFADSYPPPLSAALLALAPAALFLARIPALRFKCHYKRAALATALVIAPALAGAGVAYAVYSNSSKEADPYAEWDGAYSHVKQASRARGILSCGAVFTLRTTAHRERQTDPASGPNQAFLCCDYPVGILT